MLVNWKKLTLSELWSESRARFANDPFLTYVGEEPFTYQDVDNNIQALQGYLQSVGVSKGDRVALIAESSPYWGQVYLAVVTMGAVIVPIMVDFNEEQLKNVLEHSESLYLFASKKVLHKINDLPLVQQGRYAIINKGIFHKDVAVGNATEADVAVGNTAQQDLLKFPKQNLFHHAEEEDLAAILYTSGTTGNSKGVMLTHKNIAHQAWCGVKIGRLDGEGPYSMLSVLPLAHSYECSLGFILPMASGGSVSYLDGAPTASKMLPALQKVKPTHMLTVPLLIEKIYRSSILPKMKKSPVTRVLYAFPPTRKVLNRFVVGKKMKDLFGGNLQFYGIGGAKLAKDAERFLKECKFPYAIGYGLTETAPCIAGNPADSTVYRSTGKAFPEMELRIATPEGHNKDGEIQARGACVMPGYYKDEAKTKEVFTDDGWFRTGDLGRFDRKGNLFIRGRLKSMILGPSGKNIYPEEIEAVLNSTGYIEESLVVMMKGKLVARVRLSQEQFEKALAGIRDEETRKKKQEEILEHIRKTVNYKLIMVSRISDMIIENNPFEKTPSMKIKRYLYTEQG